MSDRRLTILLLVLWLTLFLAGLAVTVAGTAS